MLFQRLAFPLLLILAANQSALGQLADGASLSEVVGMAVERSPQVRAARHRWEAAKQSKAIAVSLPDPRLVYTDFLRRVETRTGPQRWSLGVSQTVPFPTKLVTAGRIADREARIAYLRYLAAVRDAIADAKERYFELFYIDRAQGVTQALAELYDRYAAQAVGDDREAQSALSDRFRAESQKAQLEYDLILLKEMRSAEEDRLRAALSIAPGQRIGPTADVRSPAPLTASLERLQAMALEGNQELEAAGVEVERARLGTSLARQSPIPDFTFSANYINVGPPVAATPDASRDPFAVGVGISVPLWFWKHRAEARQAKQRQLAAEATEESTRLRLRAEVSKAYFELNNSSRLARLYRETLIPQARQAMQSARELYESGQSTLGSLVETTSAFHNFQLAQLRATADYYQHASRLERLLGRPLQFSASKEKEND